MPGRGPGTAVPPGAAGGNNRTSGDGDSIPVAQPDPWVWGFDPGDSIPAGPRGGGSHVTCVISLVVMIPRCQRGGPGSIPG